MYWFSKNARDCKNANEAELTTAGNKSRKRKRGEYKQYDETLVPGSDWTMEDRGAKQVTILGLGDKGQIIVLLHDRCHCN